MSPCGDRDYRKKSKEIFPKKATHHICNNFFLANHKLHKDKKTMAKLVILVPLTVNNAFDIKLAIIEHDPRSAS